MQRRPGTPPRKGKGCSCWREPRWAACSAVVRVTESPRHRYRERERERERGLHSGAHSLGRAARANRRQNELDETKRAGRMGKGGEGRRTRKKKEEEKGETGPSAKGVHREPYRSSPQHYIYRWTLVKPLPEDESLRGQRVRRRRIDIGGWIGEKQRDWEKKQRRWEG